MASFLEEFKEMRHTTFSESDHVKNACKSEGMHIQDTFFIKTRTAGRRGIQPPHPAISVSDLSHGLSGDLSLCLFPCPGS